MGRFTADHRKYPVNQPAKCMRAVVIGNELLEFPPRNYTLPVCHIIHDICFKTYFRIFPHHVHLHSFMCMNIDILAIVSITDRDNIGNTVSMTSYSANYLLMEYIFYFICIELAYYGENVFPKKRKPRAGIIDPRSWQTGLKSSS